MRTNQNIILSEKIALLMIDDDDSGNYYYFAVKSKKELRAENIRNCAVY